MLNFSKLLAKFFATKGCVILCEKKCVNFNNFIVMCFMVEFMLYVQS